MLQLQIPPSELFDEESSKFTTVPGINLDLEHSLLSLSKWESKFQKPFLDGKQKTPEELMGYVECMVVGGCDSSDWIPQLTQEDFTRIKTYIESPESATTFGEMPERRGPKEIVTAELIYYWLVAFNIPWEAEKWHLNRLFALIRVCNIKNQQANGKAPKMSPAAAREQRARINRERREKHGTTG